MYYRKNDSRMGDELFAMAILIAPFVWKLAKKIGAQVTKLIDKFYELPIEKQMKIKYRFFAIVEIVILCSIVVNIISLFIMMIQGRLTVQDIVSLLIYIGTFILAHIRKGRYHNDTQTAFEQSV